MALNAYLLLKGQKTGLVKGSVTQKGLENRIMVIAVDHGIESPWDEASGLPTGKRRHKPLVITKELDKSSPVLYNMLRGNENITEFQLDFWAPKNLGRTGNTGAAVQHFTIMLTNARIAGIHFTMLNNRNPDLVKYAEYEEISFTYQNIAWIWKEGGITGTDDWEAPVG